MRTWTRYSNLKAAITIHGAGEDFIVHIFFNGHAFASDWTLINAAAACQNNSVGGQALARAHHHDIAHNKLLHGDVNFLRAAFHLCKLGRQLSQRAYGFARLAHGVMFQRVSKRKQKKQQSAVNTFANPRRSDRGDNHEKINIKPRP